VWSPSSEEGISLAFLFVDIAVFTVAMKAIGACWNASSEVNF